MMHGTHGLRLVLGGVVFVTACVSLIAASAATDGPVWMRQLGTGGSDGAAGAATDADGNVYLAGTAYHSPCCGDPNGSDAWVVKYDAGGKRLWFRTLATKKFDQAQAVATDASGHIYVTGYTEGSLGGAQRGGGDVWLVKFDANGNLQWKRQFGGTDFDYAIGIATDATGHIYLTGYTDGSLGGPNRGNYDAWVAKYNAAGNLLWKRQFGTSEEDFAYGIATDNAGHVYVVGSTHGSFEGVNRGGYDAWIAKFDAAGNQLWTKQTGTTLDDNAYAVATDVLGNVYLAGDAGKYRVPSEAWLAKYDATGNFLWSRRFGATTDSKAYAVATDGVGDIYLAGSTEGSLGGPDRGNDDAWVAKYDAGGKRLWLRQLGTAADDVASSVATDATGYVYVAGGTGGSLAGPLRGVSDAFLVKYSAN